MPTIFTGTPIEAHIQAVFLRAQMALASFMGGTPVFRFLLFGVLAWSIVLTFLRMASHRHHAGQGFVRIVYRIGLVFLSLGLLGSAYSSVNWAAPRGSSWASRTGVSTDARYSQTLNTSTPGLSWYLLIYESLNGVGNTMINATASAFNDNALSSDPLFLPKQLARMSAMALSADTHRALEALMKTCSDSTAGKVVGAYTNLQEMFDYTNPDCRDLWREFDESARGDAAALMEKYPSWIQTNMGAEMLRQFPFINNEALQNAALASAIYGSMQHQAGFTDSMKFWAWGNQSANTAATMSTFGDRTIEEGSQGLLSNLLLMNSADTISQFWGGNARAASRKAEASNKFNMLAPLIPPARALLHGVLSILFVLAAYAVGFGSWRPMYAWFMAEVSLCMYRPIAVLGFKAANYFAKEDQAASALASMSNSPYFIGGAKILHSQVAEIQTIYICFEIGAFVVFALGAIAAFRPLAAMTNATGLAIAGAVGQAATTAIGALAGGGGGAAAGAAGAGGAAGAAGAAGGSSGAVIVNIGRSAAAAGNSGGGASGGGEAPRPGIITPSAPTPSTWDKVG